MSYNWKQGPSFLNNSSWILSDSTLEWLELERKTEDLSSRIVIEGLEQPPGKQTAAKMSSFWRFEKREIVGLSSNENISVTKGQVFLFALFFKSRRPSLYEQQRDTFIDQVITKIWAFQWNVYGLGDPSDWKSINAIQLPTNTHKLKATTEYYAWTSILVDSTLVDPSSILSPSSSQSSSIPSLEYLPLIPSHHSYRISRISCSTFVSSRTSLVSCSSNSTSRSLQ